MLLARLDGAAFEHSTILQARDGDRSSRLPAKRRERTASRSPIQYFSFSNASIQRHAAAVVRWDIQILAFVDGGWWMVDGWLALGIRVGRRLRTEKQDSL